ncbi:hypothetical protein Tco_0977091 [Tanacetum coccineum]|uniref:Uncharacterized protein n=1 Tax=Tanacetum coccineum TaxID=301880 RepID=A0ABQ5EJ63_9ASTR
MKKCQLKPEGGSSYISKLPSRKYITTLDKINQVAGSQLESARRFSARGHEEVQMVQATTARFREQESINFLEHKMKNDPEFLYDETGQVHDSVSVLGESSKQRKENSDDLLSSRLRQYEEAKQDDGLFDMSDILEELKQSKALNALQDDVK